MQENGIFGIMCVLYDNVFGIKLIEEINEDIEKFNFLHWYRTSTNDEIRLAMEKYSNQVQALLNKFRKEIDLENIIKGKIL